DDLKSEPGAPDGSRPGRVHVNTYRITTRKRLTTESTAYHEGVPGHHMQFSIQQELQELPAGYHDKQWTRDQVVQFFHEHSAIDEVRLQSEAARYMVVPGQGAGALPLDALEARIGRWIARARTP
ncbi:MAG TPA: DUF885 family protein, partial [Vicinamibacterales bacterium]|nr:DUF885 family protein [Vicinamibacterales bacterium]